LFKLYQTGELALLKKEDGKMPHLLALREALYSAEFRQFISDVTGCGELTDRVDCAANAYVKGCHLLCHDDVIGTRKVSYIIYFPDPGRESLNRTLTSICVIPDALSSAINDSVY
jgi:Rps23 Pro-64 3,4-dihydroxylase Tpa1-like proline 4-hydroxylase